VSLAAVSVGDELPSAEFTTDPEKMKLMAALLRDPNPIHFDVDSVTKLGLGDRVITQGPMTLSFVADTVTAWAGAGSLRSLRVRMLGNVFGGDTVVCTARVTEVDESAGLITLEVQAAVGERPVVGGTATVARAGG
jgi:acyl dehydratase